MFRGKPKISEEYAWELVQKKVEHFYSSMKKAGYEFEPIAEFGNPEEHLRKFFYEQLKDKYRIEKRTFRKYIDNVRGAVKDVFYFTNGKTIEILDRIFGGYDEIEVEDPVFPGFYTSVSHKEMFESGRKITQEIRLLKQKYKKGELTKDEFKRMKGDVKRARNDLWTYGPDFSESPEVAK